MSGFRLQLFGRVALHTPEETITNFGTVRAAKLLVLLSLSRTGSLTRDRLAHHLWPDDLLDSTRLRLRQEIHRLKRVLGDDGRLLQATPIEVILSREDLTTDLDLLDGEKLDPSNSLEVLCEPFLPDWFDPWVVPERKRVDQLQIERALDLADNLESEEDRQRVHEVVKRLIDRFPLHEPLIHASMRLYASGGSLVGAVTEYQTFRRRLLSDLGIEPSSGSEELLLQLTSIQSDRGGDKSDDAVRPRSNVQLLQPESSIPHPIDQLVGRSEEMSALVGLAEDPSQRLITLTGPGGIGKTRLAIETAHRIQESFGGAVHYVSLVNLSKVDDWARVTLDSWSLTTPAEVDPKRYLLKLLGSEPTWLIADNLEHLLPKIAHEVRELLESCPQLRILATSVQPLRLSGERLFNVSPLNPETDAVDYLANVLSSVSRFAHGGDEARNDLRKIAIALEGYPLALKLASARFRLMSPAMVLEQLASPLSLSAQDRDTPERHASLESALSSSWHYLSEQQQSQLGALALLPAGAGISLVECLFGSEFLRTVDTLLDSALLTLSDEGSTVRLTLLSPIRSFVLGQTRDYHHTLRERCIRGVQVFLERYGIGLTKPVTAQASLALEAEYENIIAVGTWLDPKSPTASKIAIDLAPFEATRRRTSLWLEILKQAESSESSVPNLHRIEIILAQVVLLRGKERQELEGDLIERSRTLLETTPNKELKLLAETYWVTHVFRKDFWSVLKYANATLHLAEESGDPYFLAQAHHRKALIHHYQHEELDAIHHLELAFRGYLDCQAQLNASQVGLYLATILKENNEEKRSEEVFLETKPIALSQTSISVRGFLAETEGRMAMMDNQPHLAEPHFRESLRLWALVDNAFQQADQLLSLTRSLLAQFKWKEAGQAAIESFEKWAICSDYGGASACLANAAKILSAIGRTDEATFAASLMLQYRKVHSLALIGIETAFQDQIATELGAIEDPSMSATFEDARLVMKGLNTSLAQLSL